MINMHLFIPDPFMLVQSKISVPQSVYTAIQQYNHGIGAAAEVIKGTRSAYTANTIDPIGAEINSLVGSAEAAGTGFVVP